jgi:hypothetical protein
MKSSFVETTDAMYLVLLSQLYKTDRPLQIGGFEVISLNSEDILMIDIMVVPFQPTVKSLPTDTVGQFVLGSYTIASSSPPSIRSGDLDYLFDIRGDHTSFNSRDMMGWIERTRSSDGVFGKKLTSPLTTEGVTVVRDVFESINIQNFEKLIEVIGISQNRRRKTRSSSTGNLGF